ncbi:SCF ubiquitin ligase complex subunit [Polyrhizophydium stewartii]|uniref:SCF ubiquitin ligase complex subunit n=1 Tax=Polyrhizophydium stewartii TaxID=2732419 RepID=A0ABR4NI75_9FUNG
MSCNTETEFIERLLGPMEQHLEMPLKRAGKERKPTPPLQLLPRQQAKGGQQHQRQRQTVVSEARRRKQLPAEVLLHILSFVSSKRDLVSCMATNRQLYHCARKLLWRYPLFGSIHYWFRFCRLILSKAESPEAAAIANTVSVLNFSVIPVMGDRNQRSVVTDAVLGCPRVVLLNFYKCDWIDDVFMAKVASTCSVLRSVNLSYCADISDATVQALATQCPMVETLILRECVCISNKAMEAIAKSGWYLRRLNISNCKNITDAGLMWLTYDLDVQSSGQPIVSSRETANSGKRRANAFRYLTQLVTTRCSSLTNESLAAIAKGCPRLRTLGMAYLPNITDIGVRKLIEACTNLVMIDVQCCRRLTEASLVCAAGDRRLEVRHELLNRMRRIQAPAQVPEQAPAPEPIAEPMSPQPLLPPTPSFGGLVGEPSTPQDVTEVQTSILSIPESEPSPDTAFMMEEWGCFGGLTGVNPSGAGPSRAGFKRPAISPTEIGQVPPPAPLAAATAFRRMQVAHLMDFEYYPARGGHSASIAPEPPSFARTADSARVEPRASVPTSAQPRASSEPLGQSDEHAGLGLFQSRAGLRRSSRLISNSAGSSIVGGAALVAGRTSSSLSAEDGTATMAQVISRIDACTNAASGRPAEPAELVPAAVTRSRSVGNAASSREGAAGPQAQ